MGERACSLGGVNSVHLADGRDGQRVDKQKAVSLLYRSRYDGSPRQAGKSRLGSQATAHSLRVHDHTSPATATKSARQSVRTPEGLLHGV